MHRGYYQIALNMTYYTLQQFCKMSKSPDAFQNATRGFNNNLEHGRLIESRLSQLRQDIRDNWDTTYSVNRFPPARRVDGKKINATKNRHILCMMFVDVPLIAWLVKKIEYKYKKLEVRSVWMMEKSSENDGFQVWHRDFYLGTEITMTIVVNVRALTK
jgi:hypothetical protein